VLVKDHLTESGWTSESGCAPDDGVSLSSACVSAYGVVVAPAGARSWMALCATLYTPNPPVCSVIR